MQQSLQNLTGQGLSLPQVAAAAQQLQQLQESQQLLQQHAGQRGDTKPNSVSGGTPLSTSKNQQQQHHQQQQQHIAHMLQQLPQGPPLTKAQLTSPAHTQLYSELPRQPSPITRKEAHLQDHLVTKASFTSNGGNSFAMRSRNDPSPEEMTDLEELEQFAKTFKQRRIKLG